MFDFLHSFDAFTMAFLVAVLYFSLSAVLVYTYLCRRTYPGFGSMALAQVLWSFGLAINFFRPFEESVSLYLGSVMMLLYGVFLFRGLLRYGNIMNKYHMIINYIAVIITSIILAYYLYVDYNTCARVVVFSLCMAFLFFRIAVEPFMVKGWQRHATQSLLSILFVFFGSMFVFRAYKAFYAVRCLPSGPDEAAKILFFLASVLTPVLTFSIIAMTFARLEAELRKANEELQKISETDALTDLANRRKFDAVCEDEWKRAVDMQLGVALVMLDVDDFKHYNDQYGHQAGDECLRKLAQVLQKHARRAKALAARYGGEEFAMILPGVGAEAACALAEDVRRSFAQLGTEHETGRHGNVVTVSVGVAALVDVRQKNLCDLLRTADAALYAAKANGKNAVVFSA